MKKWIELYGKSDGAQVSPFAFSPVTQKITKLQNYKNTRNREVHIGKVTDVHLKVSTCTEDTRNIAPNDHHSGGRIVMYGFENALKLI